MEGVREEVDVSDGIAMITKKCQAQRLASSGIVRSVGRRLLLAPGQNRIRHDRCGYFLESLAPIPVIWASIRPQTILILPVLPPSCQRTLPGLPVQAVDVPGAGYADCIFGLRSGRE
jgi:hypothetical protein